MQNKIVLFRNLQCKSLFHKSQNSRFDFHGVNAFFETADVEAGVVCFLFDETAEDIVNGDGLPVSIFNIQEVFGGIRINRQRRHVVFFHSVIVLKNELGVGALVHQLFVAVKRVQAERVRVLVVVGITECRAGDIRASEISYRIVRRVLVDGYQQVVSTVVTERSVKSDCYLVVGVGRDFPFARKHQVVRANRFIISRIGE